MIRLEASYRRRSVTRTDDGHTVLEDAHVEPGIQEPDPEPQVVGDAWTQPRPPSWGNVLETTPTAAQGGGKTFPGLWALIPTELHDRVKIGTVESLQGTEADLVAASTTRSNRDGNLGFLDCPRRFCVLTSRAKRVLLLFGTVIFS